MLVNELIRIGPNDDGNESSSKWRTQFQSTVEGITLLPSVDRLGGECLALDFCGAHLYYLHSGPQKIMRKRHCPRGRFAPMVIIPLEGEITVTQNDRTCTIEAGNFAFMDSASPLSLVYGSEFRHLYLNLPSSSFGPAVFHKTVSRTFRDPSAFDHVFVNLIKGIWENATALQPLEHGSALNSILSLSMLTTPVRDHTNDFDPGVRVKGAISYIEHNLAMEWLTPQTVADAQGVSRRYLDDLFGNHGLRIERWIWERRLLRAKEDLALSSRSGLHKGNRSGSHKEKSILNIALDVGFKSPSHFTRSFVERFGISPRDYKKLIKTRSDS